MKRASKQTEKSSKGIKSSSKVAALALKGVGVAASAGVAAVAKAVQAYVSEGDKIQKITTKLGGTAEMWGELGYLAERNGIQFNTLTMATQRLQRRLAEIGRDGKGTASKALAQLGIEADKLLRMPIDEQLLAIADAMEQAGDDAGKVLASFGLFDSEGVAMVQMLKTGRAEMERLQKEARNLGAVISNEGAAGAEMFTDQLTNMGAQAKGVRNSLVEGMLPALLSVGDSFYKTEQDVGFWIKAGQMLGKTIVTIVNAFDLLWSIVKATGHTLAGAAKMIATFFGTVVAQAVGKAQAAIEAYRLALDGEFTAAAAMLKQAAGDHIDLAEAARLAKDEMVEGFRKSGEAMTGWAERATQRVNDIEGKFEELAQRVREATAAQEEANQLAEESQRVADQQARAVDALKGSWSDYNMVMAGFPEIYDSWMNGSESVIAALEAGNISLADAETLIENMATAMAKAGGEIRAESEKNKTKIEGDALIMERAFNNLAGVMSGMWESWAEEGRISFDSIKDGLKGIASNMLAAFSTDKIAAQLGNLAAGKDVNWQDLKAGVGTALANIAVDKFAGWLGSKTAPEYLGTHTNWAEAGGMYGAAIGAAVGSIIPGIGTALGSLIGGIMGSLTGGVFQKLFGKDYLPQLLIAGTGSEVADKIGGYGNKRIDFETAFGQFMVYNQNDLGPDGDQLVQDMIEAIKTFDQGLADIMTDHQLGTVIENLANWGKEWTGEAVNIEEVLTHRFDQILTHFGYLTDGVVEYVDQFTSLESRTEAFVRFVASFNMMAAGLKTFIERDLSGIGAETMSVVESMRHWRDEVRMSMVEFERTPEAMDRITHALNERYRAEIAFIEQIGGLIQNIKSSVANTRSRLETSFGQGGEKLTVSELFSMISANIRKISYSQSPDAIQSLFQITSGLIGRAGGLLDANQFGSTDSIDAEIARIRGLMEDAEGGELARLRDELLGLKTDRQSILDSNALMETQQGQLMRLLDNLERAALGRAEALQAAALVEAEELRLEAQTFAQENNIRLDNITSAQDATTTAVNDQTDALVADNAIIKAELGSMSESLNILAADIRNKADRDVIREELVPVS
jgi:hypothetical protein